MKRSLMAAVLLATAALPAYASNLPELDGEISRLQHEWARIKYSVGDTKAQGQQMMSLADQANALVAKFPTRAEPLIWDGIITSSAAGIAGGLDALSLVKKARDMLEKAEQLDAKALEGSAATSLGSLYYQVPGFPLGFGNNKTARRYLEQSLAQNPDGIDPNFFYGDFLYRQGDYQKAADALRHALAAPDRPGREDADSGRRSEIKQLLAEIDHKLERKKKS